jgi:hypothetical protein
METWGERSETTKQKNQKMLMQALLVDGWVRPNCVRSLYTNPRNTYEVLVTTLDMICWQVVPYANESLQYA